MPVSFDDSCLDGRYQAPQQQAQTKAPWHTVHMVLFKIFFNVLFSLCGPVDSCILFDPP